MNAESCHCLGPSLSDTLSWLGLCPKQISPLLVDIAGVLRQGLITMIEGPAASTQDRADQWKRPGTDSSTLIRMIFEKELRVKLANDAALTGLILDLRRKVSIIHAVVAGDAEIQYLDRDYAKYIVDLYACAHLRDILGIPETTRIT